jgi:hypothetical protein
MPAFIDARPVARALASLLTASLLATCGDDSSSSKDDRGVFGDMADALQSAQADFLTANTAIFASVEYMKPYIAELLELPPVVSASVSTPTSCLLDGVGGRTYTINGEPFTSVTDTLVPDNTARFRLFQLSNTGQPLLNHDIGYIDYRCIDADTLVTEVRISSDTILIASITYPAATGKLGGVFRVPDGSRTLAFGRLGDDESMLRIKFQIPGFPCSYDFPTSGTGTRSGGALVARYLPERRDLDFDFQASSLDSILGGFVLYADTQLNLAACIESGTLSAPVFSFPSTECHEEYELMLVNHAQLQAMSENYIALRALWLTTANLMEICRSLVPLGQ